MKGDAMSLNICWSITRFRWIFSCPCRFSQIALFRFTLLAKLFSCHVPDEIKQEVVWGGYRLVNDRTWIQSYLHSLCVTSNTQASPLTDSPDISCISLESMIEYGKHFLELLSQFRSISFSKVYSCVEIPFHERKYGRNTEFRTFKIL